MSPIGAGLSAQFGCAEEVYTNEVQRISGTPSGVFGVTFEGANTITTLATNCSAAALQAALEALPNIGTGGVSCTGGPLPTAIDTTFSGPLVSKRNVGAMAVQGAVTGLTFSTQTPGTGYGDAQTVTRFLEHQSESIEAQVERIESRALRAGRRFLRADRFVPNRKGAAGAVPFEVMSKGFGLLFKHALGGVAISTPGGGTNTRDHLHTPADLWNKSMTVQVNRPDRTATDRPFTYVGGKIVSWSLENSVDGLLVFTPTFDFRDEDTAVALATASYPSAQELLSFVGGQVTIDSANFDVTSFSVQMGQGLKTDRHHLRNSTLKKEPIHNQDGEATGSLEMEFESLYVQNKFKSATASGAIAAITALWEGSIIESAFRFGVLVTIQNARIDGTTPTAQGPDVITQTVPFTATDDGTNPVVSLRYRTTDTAS